ncbi:MAG: trypsin-like peptidase domain-containing protein [Planctomycetota bacterium]
MIHPFWDMALLEVEGLDREPLTLKTQHPDELREKEIAIIGYPAQDSRNDAALQSRIFDDVFNVKRLQPGKVKLRRELTFSGTQAKAMTHDSSTLGGNSGSAVIEIETGKVVGLHFAGLYLDANFAVPSFEMARDPRVVDAGVRFDGDVPPTDEWDSHWRRADPDDFGPPKTVSVPVAGQTGTINTVRLTGSSSGDASAVNWTIPLQISVTVEQPQIGQRDKSVARDSGETESENEFLFRRRKKQQDDVAIQLSLDKFSKSSLSNENFDWLTALSATVFSRLSYWERSAIRRRVLGSYQFTHCEVFSPGSMQAIVAIDEDLVVVAFRGTANQRNWLINLNTFGTRAGGYGKVHGGFYHAFQSARPAIEDYIARHTSSEPRLVLAGHSLGGALATIAAAEWLNPYKLLSVYTVGQPAAGKSDFREFAGKHFGDRFFRMVNEDDLVPMVPPGYKHVGQTFHFETDGTVNRSMAESIAEEEETLTAEAFDLMQQQIREELDAEEAAESLGQEGIPNTKDHGTDKYLRKILMQLGSL